MSKREPGTIKTEFVYEPLKEAVSRRIPASSVDKELHVSEFFIKWCKLYTHPDFYKFKFVTYDTEGKAQHEYFQNDIDNFLSYMTDKGVKDAMECYRKGEDL